MIPLKIRAPPSTRASCDGLSPLAVGVEGPGVRAVLDCARRDAGTARAASTIASWRMKPVGAGMVPNLPLPAGVRQCHLSGQAQVCLCHSPFALQTRLLCPTL